MHSAPNKTQIAPAPNRLLQALASNQWHTGNLIAYSHLDGPTDSVAGLVARTVNDGLDFCYPGTLSLHFPNAASWQKCFLTNDWFEAHGTDGTCTRGLMLDAHHLLIEGPCEITHIDDACYQTAHSPNRLLIGSASFYNQSGIHADFDEIAAKRLQWLDEQLLKQHGRLPEDSRYSFARALSQMKGQLMSPTGQIRAPWTTPDRWPHRHMWLWDSAFHAIGWRHLDPAIAQQMLDALFSVQNTSGFIPHQITPLYSSSITQPPVLSLGVELVLAKSHDMKWLADVYPKLCAYVRWNAANRDSDGGGLLEWYIEGDPDCRSGESGMDNSPRFDTAIQLDAPDFNAYQSGEYERLARFAELLGLPDEAKHWQELHRKSCQLINDRLWNDNVGLYCDLDPQTGAFTSVLSSASFLPLYCGAPTRQQAARLVEHLKNPDTFGKPFPIPSIAAPMSEASDRGIYSKDMWRGPTWVNINWLVARGLRRYGYHAEADALRTVTLAELERTCTKWGTFFEYFDDRLEVEPPDLLRKRKNTPGCHPHQAIHDYGWSATLYVDWLLENGTAQTP